MLLFRVDKDLWVLIGCNICIVGFAVVTCVRDGQTESARPLARAIEYPAIGSIQHTLSRGCVELLPWPPFELGIGRWGGSSKTSERTPPAHNPPILLFPTFRVFATLCCASGTLLPILILLYIPVRSDLVSHPLFSRFVGSSLRLLRRWGGANG